MKEKRFSIKNITRYLAVLKGVKLPWILIICSFLTSIIMMNAEIQVATMTADIIDTSQNAINAKALISYISMAALSAAFNIVSIYFTKKMEEVITLRVRVKLWNCIMYLPAKFYDEDNGNELVSRVTSDATAPASLFSIAVSCVVCIVTTVQAFIQLFTYNTILAKYALLIIPLTLIVCVLYGIIQFKLGVYNTVTMAGSLGYLSEHVRNFRLIKSAVAEKLESKKGNKTFKKMYKAELLDWLIVAGYQAISSIFSIMFIVIVFVIGGQLIPSGEVTIGNLTGFYMISGIVTLQLMQFFMNIGSVASCFGSMKKMSQIMATDSEPTGGKSLPDAASDIVFNNVTFSYSDDKDALKELSLSIPAGKVTAIIGGNGAGKSTIFKLIERLYEPSSGEIRFGDEDILSYNIKEWRDKFSYVSQQSPLIGGTVRDNITYGINRDISEEELISVARKANCYDFIMEKPNGFNEDVGLDGSNFSGGQGQCISIARAMLRNTDYLLLDEATSNLDVVSEALVTQAINRLMNGKTTIMIAHNYAATRNANYIIVLKDGKVDAAGTPEELIKHNEYYQMFSKIS